MYITEIKIKFVFITVLLFSACFYNNLFSQIKERNLVPNPGFEVYKGKKPLPVIKSAKPWVNVGTVDFYNKIDSKDSSEFKGPHTGKCYVGIRFQAKYKEYAYVKLIETLKKDREYYFSMYVRLNDLSTVAIKQLGVFISDSPFKMGMQFNPEGIIDTTYQNGLSGNLGWIPISGKYKAKGGEKYLIIGNFTTETKEDFVKKNKWKVFELKEAFYYLDDVALMDTTYVPVPKTIDTIKTIDSAVVTQPVIEHKMIEIKTVYFENASHLLQKKSSLIIDQIVALADENSSIELEVKGFTDNQGSHEQNLHLSRERAEQVYAYLKKKGVKNKMTYKGYGEKNPIAPNDTPTNRSKNRRVEIHLIKKY
jgi:outer membrane protein OmpA-like peptidoglycan-associated protein